MSQEIFVRPSKLNPELPNGLNGQEGSKPNRAEHSITKCANLNSLITCSTHTFDWTCSPYLLTIQPFTLSLIVPRLDNQSITSLTYRTTTSIVIIPIEAFHSIT